MIKWNYQGLKRFVNHKTSGYQLLKGKEGTGKAPLSIQGIKPRKQLLLI